MFYKIASMRLPEVQLPSNRKFGIFAVFCFTVLAIYLMMYGSSHYAIFSILISFLLMGLTLVAPDLLLPLNRLWMRLGLILGIIVSPLVMGLIFFGVFTPISLLMSIIGRDELRLKPQRKESHWIVKEKHVSGASGFKLQY